MRKVFFWIHLTADVLAGAVILIMSVTGALLALETPVLRAVERSRRAVTVPARDTMPLGSEALLSKVLESRPDARPSALTVDADRAAAVLVSLGPQVLFVDPCTGRITGEGASGWRGFFRAVTDWHRWLAMSGERRDTGRAITGACNAAFLFLALSGVVLWWPKEWSTRFVRPITWFQLGLAGRPRDFNWHNVIGFWSSSVLVVLTFTGMTISYPAVGNLLYKRPAAGPGGQGGGAAREAGAHDGRGGRDGRKPEPLGAEAFVGFDRLLARAKAQLPNWTLVAMRFPQRPGISVTLALTDSPSRSPYGRSALTLDPATARVVKWEPFSSFGTGRKLRVAARWAHTGEIAGWPGQLVAGVASAGSAVLVWTGVALAWRRFRARRRVSLADRRTASGVIDFDSVS